MWKLRLATILIGLLTTELLAWWWMNPREDQKEVRLLDWNPVNLGIDAPPKPSTGPTSTITWQPEMVQKYRDSLNCSNGSICEIKRDNGATLHAALFSWDNSSSVTAIEAFRHHPEDCLGSIGMKLLQHYPAKIFQVEDQELHFNHSAFRDQEGITVHSFKATWFAGKTQSFVTGISQNDHWREQRTTAALSRFRPKHARVVQGAVRSIHDPEKAWKFFEQSVLHSLVLK